MISDQRAEAAFEYLRDTVGLIGNAKGELERSEILAKRTRKKAFLASSGTVAERDARVEQDQDVIAADERYVEAVVQYETIKARREIETIALDVWRTESANRRRG